MSASYQNHYLEQYWPRTPNNPDMWQDNLELLHAYFEAADLILGLEPDRLDALDISTGPCLAPLMASMQCMNSVRLSDFTPSNRDQISSIPIDYWTEYAAELVRLFPDRDLSVQALLSRLEQLRSQHEPLDVDLRRSPIFVPEVIELRSAGLLTMHFVVDSICDTPEECFQMLRSVLPFVKPSGYVLLSSLIESNWWMLGDTKEPSPKISEADVENLLKQEAFRILSRARSTPKAAQIYEGGWTVFLARHEP